MEEGWLQVWCYLYRGVITSDMTADPMPISDMIACIAQLRHTCMIGSFIQISVFVMCCSIRQGISDIPTGRMPLQWVC